MKRRLFLKGLLSASAVSPVVAKAVTEVNSELALEKAINDIEKYEIDTGRTLESIPRKMAVNTEFNKAMWPGINKFYDEAYNSQPKALLTPEQIMKESLKAINS